MVFVFQTHNLGVSRFKGFKSFASIYAEFREKLPSFEKAQMSISSQAVFEARGMPLISYRIKSGRTNEIFLPSEKNSLTNKLPSPSAKGPWVWFLSNLEVSQKSSQAFTIGNRPFQPFVKDHTPFLTSPPSARSRVLPTPFTQSGRSQVFSIKHLRPDSIGAQSNSPT